MDAENFLENKQLRSKILKLRNENKLLKQQSKVLKQIFQAQKMGCWYLNKKTNQLHLSSDALKVLGISPSKTKTHWALFQETIHPDDKETVISTLITALESSQNVDLRFRTIQTNNLVQYIKMQATPNKTAGKITEIRGTVQNISEQTQKDVLYTESDLRYKTIFHDGLAAIIVADDKGNYLEANKAASEILGYSEEELVKMNVAELVTTTAANAEELYALYLSKGTETGQFHFKDKWGNHKTAYYKAIRLKPDFNLSMMMDITEMIHYQNKLSELLEDKNRFIAIIAHDLKNPFNTLLGFTDLIIRNLHRYDQTKIQSQLQIINQTVYQTYSMLEDLLAWSTTKAEQMKINLQTIEMCTFTNDILAYFSFMAKNKNITIQNQIENHIMVKADMNMTKTIMRNLISNAIKFTPENGLIILQATAKDDYVNISITDSGKGIRKEHLNKLWDFNDFFSTTGTSGEKGTGFGLMLCKIFIEKHNGKIWVESEPNKGSSFHFTLPYSINE